MKKVSYSSPLKNKRGKLKKVLWFLGGVLGVTLLFILGVFIYFALKLPPVEFFEQRIVEESTKIYDRTGTVLLYEVGGSLENGQILKRTYVPLEKISPYLQKAIVAAEDKNFYKHFGIDPKAMLRALYIFIKTKGKVAQGASTITQQLVKNSLLTPEKTLKRKIQEIILSVMIERRYGKDKILEFYLNQINFGSVFYGVESAAQNYFGKSAKDLTLSESATLAAITQAPGFYLKNKEAREKRKNWILDRMVELKMISKEEAEKAKEEKISLEIKPAIMKAPYFTHEVLKILEDLYGKDFGSMGLKVKTTLSIKLQELAEKTINEWKDKIEKNFGAKNVALVALDPKSGEILAMVGGRDFKESQVNIWMPTTKEGFQSPGSAFKPIVYATAFSKGYTPETILWDVKTDFGIQGKSYIPLNFDKKERGPVKMAEALAQSLNIPAVETLYLAGIQDVIEQAKKMGMLQTFDQKIDPTVPGLSMAVGGKSVHPLELVSAFGVFAAEGKRYLPHFILEIEDRNGKIIYAPESYPVQALSKEVAQMINWILSDNSLRAPIFGANSYLNLGPFAAIKTGTAAFEENKPTDVWAIGYTRDLVVGVWAGNNYNEPLKPRALGANISAPIWNQFMKEATKDYQKIAFSKPNLPKTGKPILDGILPTTEVVLDKLSQKLASPLTPEELRETKKFPVCHSILYYVKKDDPQGPPPQKPESDPQFRNWESAVRSWCQKNGFLAPSETTPYHQESNLPKFTLLEKFAKKEDSGGKITSLKFSFKVEAPLGMKTLTLFHEGNVLEKIENPTSNDFSFEFQIPKDLPQKESYTIEIQAEDSALNKSKFILNFP
jgi:1A family penicillin-binding protein